MDGPDPRAVKRRPMARAGIASARARRPEAGERTFTLFADGALDLDVLHRLVESAEAISEGAAYPAPGGETWFGTTSLTLDLSRLPLSDPADAGLARRLAATLMSDKRAERVINDRLYRELARLLGTATPLEFEVTAVATAEGRAVRLVADLEAPLAALVGTHGGR